MTETATARSRLVVALAGLIAVVGVLGINDSALTPGAHGDSVEYLSAAESFASDGTFSIPITHWSRTGSVAELSHFPPGYPVVLSTLIRLGLPSPAAALWATALAAGVAVGGLALLVLPFGLAPMVLCVAALLSTPVFVRLHLAIWSEPVFLAITVVLLVALVRRPNASWLHGLLAAAGLAVRYVGIAGTLLAMTLGVLRGRTWRDRAWAMAQAGLPSLLFLGWWSRRVDTAGEVIRDFGVQAGLGRARDQFIGLMAEWPLSGGLGGLVGLEGAGRSVLGGAALLLGVGLVWSRFRGEAWVDTGRRTVLRTMLLYVACYLPVVVLSRLFADPRIPFDVRIFYPVLVLITVLMMLAASEAARSRGRAGWAVFAVVAGGWWLTAVADVRTGVAAVNESGLYFTSVGWAEDPVLRWVVDRSAPWPAVYSNEPAMVYFLTGRHAKALPREGEDLDAFARRLGRVPGPIVFVAPPHVDDVSPQLFVDRLRLQRVVGSGSAVLFLPSGPPPAP